MMQRTITVTVDDPTPEELAFYFSNLFNDGQARFFNELAKLTEKWDVPFCSQLQSIIDSPLLTAEGRNIMKQIAEYGQARVLIEAEKSPLLSAQEYSNVWNTSRQQAAREVFEIMGGWPLNNDTLIDLRGRVARHFGLEEL